VVVSRCDSEVRETSRLLSGRGSKLDLDEGPIDDVLSGTGSRVMI
jgi:hypothetical protein